MHVELYVHTRDHGEWGLCVVARTRPNLGGYGAARAPNGPAPYNQHFLLPDALHSTSSVPPLASPFDAFFSAYFSHLAGKDVSEMGGCIHA